MERNYKFTENIIDRLTKNSKKLCSSVRYYIFITEICIPNDKNIHSAVNSAIFFIKLNNLSKNYQYKTFQLDNNSMFELLLFNIGEKNKIWQQDSQKLYNLNRLNINFFDINLYSNYAIKLGYSKSADRLFNNNFAALFIDFKVNKINLESNEK